MSLANDLLAWYDCYKRELPWRKEVTAYHTWISEIMLQQTQVKTVIPYYHRFLELFPTVDDLAKASEEELLKAWEGLGYYSRVRNMQEAAKQIVKKGYFPNNYKALLELKGIGPYTAGAIASIAFNEAVPAVDGNVLRIYTRLFEIGEDVSLTKTNKMIQEKVKETLSTNRPGDFNQALMDLGSQICTPKNARCSDCPIQSYCQSQRNGSVEYYPYKAKKVKQQHKYYIACAIQNYKNQLFSYVQRPEKGILAKMYSFPLIEIKKEEYEQYCQLLNQTDHNKIAEQKEHYEATLQQLDSTPVWQWLPLGEVTHIFTHQKWHVVVAYGVVTESNNMGQWFSLTPEEIPLSKIQQKINHCVLQFIQ